MSLLAREIELPTHSVPVTQSFGAKTLDACVQTSCFSKNKLQYKNTALLLGIPLSVLSRLTVLC